MLLVGRVEATCGPLLLGAGLYVLRTADGDVESQETATSRMAVWSEGTSLTTLRSLSTTPDANWRLST